MALKPRIRRTRKGTFALNIPNDGLDTLFFEIVLDNCGCWGWYHELDDCNHFYGFGLTPFSREETLVTLVFRNVKTGRSALRRRNSLSQKCATSLASSACQRKIVLNFGKLLFRAAKSGGLPTISRTTAPTWI